MKSVLLVGGTGTISLSLARLLAECPDWDLHLLNRGGSPHLVPPGATVHTADIHDPAAVQAALGDRRFDAVAHFLCYTPEDAAACVDLFAGRTDHYLHISTCATYRKPIERYPITEDAPLGNTAWDYGLLKEQAEAVLRRSDLPLTVVRPSHTYDRRNLPLAVRGKNAWSTLRRIEAGKPVLIHGDGASLWTLTHAEDFAIGFLGLMDNPAAVGETINLVSDEALSWEVIYRRIGEAMDKPIRALFLPSDEIARRNPALRGGLLGDKAHSLLFDTSRLRRLAPAFETRIRFTVNTIRTILDTMRATPALQLEDPEFDAWCDAVVADHADKVIELANRYRKLP